MSVLVTTTISQGAVFYAGETLSCTIAFTNPIHNINKSVKTSHSTPIPFTNATQHQTNSTTTAAPAQRSQSRTISSLASSTLAFLTRNRQPSVKAAPKPLDIALANTMTNDEDTDGIPIELDSPTPRSSIDTFLQQSLSPRSSMDSNASFHSSVLPSRRYSSSPLKKPVSEHLICGFAQVVGSFVADANLINVNEFDPLKHYTMYNPQGGFGGGGGLMVARSDSHLDTRTLPVFSIPPSILFVDLDLAPGETKKFSYKIQLPNDIPPSHRGKAIRFNYYLVIGTQRAHTTAKLPSIPNQGQIVQIRFRVLNHVSEDGSRPIYDLLNPVVLYKDQAIVTECHSDKSEARKENKLIRDPLQLEKKKAFLDYVNELFENRMKKNTIPEITRRDSDVYDEKDVNEEADKDQSCFQIVSRITHRSKKAMYDICKSNQRVAKLHLVKTAYRLGEPIVGVLDFSEAVLLTYKTSIFLESSESIENTIALKSSQYITRVSRKTHSDFHSICLDNKRLSFSLPIPAIASPEFQTTGVSLKYFLRFEFLTGISNQPPFIPIMIDEKHRHHQSLQDIEVSTFDCQIPVTVYGSPGGVDRALYGRPHTFRVQ
ncbi:MAG: Rgp1-domain-containing protein [Benjaminiella poitrasii]|nr:MAG: Rgp1-domain-containing protein [Benjaminiella poitrasii]